MWYQVLYIFIYVASFWTSQNRHFFGTGRFVLSFSRDCITDNCTSSSLSSNHILLIYVAYLTSVASHQGLKRILLRFKKGEFCPLLPQVKGRRGTCSPFWGLWIGELSFDFKSRKITLWVQQGSYLNEPQMYPGGKWFGTALQSLWQITNNQNHLFTS